MDQKIQNHSRSDACRRIAVVTAVLLLVLAISSLVTLFVIISNPNICNDKISGSNALDTESGENQMFIITPEKSVMNSEKVESRIYLSSGPLMASEGGNPTISRSITATVLPVDAPDKSVDWTVYWIVNPFGESAVVTNYVTVVPTSNGSTTANVIASQAFEGAIIGIRATTRVGGFTATCNAVYEGAPDQLVVSYNGGQYSTTNHVSLAAGSSYNMDLTLVNAFNDIGSKYGTYELISLTGTGEFVANKTIYERSKETQYTTENIQMSDNIDYFISASLQGSTLTVTAKHSVSSFFKAQYGSNGGIEWAYKSAYYDPRGGGQPTACYLGIYVRETVSGKECLLYVDITATVESLALSSTTLTF